MAMVSALPSRTASIKSSGLPMPSLAMIGTSTFPATAPHQRNVKSLARPLPIDGSQ